MLKKIEIKNFKSLKNICYQPTGLNVLMGLNGVGKSSFIQTLLLMKQIGSSFSGEQFLISFNGEIIELGTLKDVFYCYSEEKEIVFSFHEDSFKDDIVITLPYDLNNGDADTIKPKYYPTIEDYINFLDHCSKIQYISANRLGPQQEHFFFTSKVNAKNWGINGEHALAYLAEKGNSSVANANMLFNANDKDASLITQVNNWMSTISPGTNIHADKLPSISKTILSVSFAKSVGQNKFRPQNVGYGISYTLPIVIMLLSARPGDCLIIENPEAHIHPKGQAELGRLLALCASCGVQIFVETHSDHIVNGIRVAVKKHLIEKTDVKFAFFERKEQKFADITEQYTDITDIKVDHNGELSHYPDGFMDEWNIQLMELF